MKYAGIILFFLTGSCGLQQQLRHRSVQHEIRQAESRHSDSFRIESKSAHLYLHTTDQKTIAELQPEGIFEYTPEQGFKGRAHRVIIHQVQQQATLSRDSSQVQLLHAAQSFNKESTGIRVRDKVIRKEGRRFAWPVAAGGAVLVLLLVVWLRYGRR
jgi:hypothetical protein